MRLKQLSKIPLLVLFVWASEVNAQNIIVRSVDGNETVNQIGSLRKFSFSGDQLVLNFTDGTINSFGLIDVSMIYFENVGSSVKDQLSSGIEIMAIFPNPVNNVLTINHLTTEGLALIYRIDGKMVLNKTVAPEQPTIDVSTLPAGLYLMKLSNQTLKFVKQ